MADLEPRVLIVDDEKHDIELVEEALSPIRLRIFKLTEPREVLQKVENESPDVVILDALLPGMSGFDLCKEIKSAPDSKKTSVLILTGVYLRDHYRREAIHQFKADGFLTKPFRARELQRTFLKILARKLRMSPRKVQEELAAGQDILLPSELEEKSGWLGRIFGKLRPSSEPSVSAGFLHTADQSAPAPVDPVEPIEARKPDEPIGEDKPTVEGDESTKPEATAEEKQTLENAPSMPATDGPETAEGEVEEKIIEEQEPEEPEPEEPVEAEKKPSDPEEEVEREEEKSITEEQSVLVMTSERNVEKVEDGGLPDVAAGEAPEQDVAASEAEDKVEPVKAIEAVAPHAETPADTPPDNIDEGVQGHLSSVWDDLPVGEPEEIPTEIDTAEPEVVVEAESAPPEPEVVAETGAVGPEPEADVEAETTSPEQVIAAEPVVPEPEPSPEKEPALESVPTVEGEIVSEPEPAPEESPDIDAEPVVKPVDLDSAKALFEALEVEGLEAEEEIAKLADADPARTMPDIDPLTTEKLRAAIKRPRATFRKDKPETPAAEAQARKPVSEPINKIAKKPAARTSEAPSVEPVEVDAEAIPETPEKPVVEVAAGPQPVIDSKSEKAVEATTEPAPAVTETAAPEPEPTAKPVVEPKAKPVAEPEAERVAEPKARPVAEPKARPVVEPTAKPVIEPKARPVAEPKARPVVEPTAKPVVEPTTKPVAEPKAKPVAEPKAKPVAEPKAKPVAEPKAKPVVEPKAKPVVEPKAKPVAEPKAKPVAEPKAKPVAEPKAKPVVEPKAKPVAEPKAKPVAEPKAKPVAEPKAKPVAEPKAKPVTRRVVTPTPEPAAETDEDPPLDVPRELAIYREPEFRRELKRELSKCRRVERPLTLILVRVTDLGQIVEIFGKTYRPKVLVHVAEQVLGALRDVDSVGLLESQELLALTAFASDRYGGERIISRLRKALRSHPFDVGLGIAAFVPKLLFGVASFPKDADTVEELLLHAEKEIAAE